MKGLTRHAILDVVQYSNKGQKSFFEDFQNGLTNRWIYANIGIARESLA